MSYIYDMMTRGGDFEIKPRDRESPIPKNNEVLPQNPKPPYPEFCYHPAKCAASGRCERDICCAD